MMREKCLKEEMRRGRNKKVKGMKRTIFLDSVNGNRGRVGRGTEKREREWERQKRLKQQNERMRRNEEMRKLKTRRGQIFKTRRVGRKRHRGENGRKRKW